MKFLHISDLNLGKIITKLKDVNSAVISSPHGFFMNKFMKPSAGFGYVISRGNDKRRRRTPSA